MYGNIFFTLIYFLGFSTSIEHNHLFLIFKPKLFFNISVLSFFTSEQVNAIRASGGKWPLSGGRKGCSRLICCGKF